VGGVAYVGASASMKYHDSHCRSTYSVKSNNDSSKLRMRIKSSRTGGHFQTGSLAGAAHLLNFNADALRLTQREQKSLVD
jgi:hypothetical protein